MSVSLLHDTGATDVITGNRHLCLWIKKLDTPIDMFGFNNSSSLITEYGYLPQFGLALIFDGLKGTIISFSMMHARGFIWSYDNSSDLHTLYTKDGFKICDFSPTNRLYRADFTKITYHPVERENIRKYLTNKLNNQRVGHRLPPRMPNLSDNRSSTNLIPTTAIQPPAPITRVSDKSNHLPGDFNIHEQANDAVKFIPLPATSPNFRPDKETPSLALMQKWALARRLKASLGWSTNIKQQYHQIDNIPFTIKDIERSDIYYKEPVAEVQGRIQKRSQKPSLNHQKPAFGERVHCDIIPGEYWFWIFMIEDTYKLPIIRILKNGKSNKYLLPAITEMVSELQQLTKVKVTELWSDNESVFRSLVPSLRQDLDIKWRHSASQDHSTYIENAKKIFNAMARSMYAGQLLPVLPNTEEYFISMVIQNMSLMPNADTGPNSTPYTKAHKTRPHYGMISSYYGMPVVYYDDEETRTQKSIKKSANPTDTIGILPPLDSSNVKAMPSGELGFIVGRDWQSTDNTVWIYDLRSGEILNRSRWREVAFTMPQIQLVWKRKEEIDIKRKRKAKETSPDYYKLSTNDNNDVLIIHPALHIENNETKCAQQNDYKFFVSIAESLRQPDISNEYHLQFIEHLMSSPSFTASVHNNILSEETQQYENKSINLNICNAQLSPKKAVNKHGKDSVDAALIEELTQLLDTNTLLTPISKYNEVVYGNVHYEEKQLISQIADDNEIVYTDYLRARLTADGSKQQFSPTEQRSSPTVHQDSLTLALHICSLNKWFLSSADIKGAYLKVDVTKRPKKTGLKLRKAIADILVKLKPEWKQYQNKTDGSIIVLLGTALYGLGDSGALWYEVFNGALIEFGFERSPVDKCMYKYSKEDGTMLLPLFVDDILVMASHLELRERFIKFLEERFGKLKQQTGSVIKHLGVRIEYDQITGVMKLDQKEFLQELFKKFPTKGTATTPSTTNLFKRSDLPEDNQPTDRKYYMSMLMSIAFAAQRTRLDYAKEVGWLAQHMATPTTQDQRNLDRLYMNAKHTIDKVRVIAPKSSKLEQFVDSSHAIHTNFRGHTGIVLKFGGSTLSVTSKAQTLNSHSSCETELIGLDYATTRLQPWIYHLEWLDIKCIPVTVYQDNKSVIRMTDESFQQTSKSKHIGIRFFYVQQLVKNEIIVIEYRNTKDMWADIMTKPLSGRLYIKMRNAILEVT